MWPGHFLISLWSNHPVSKLFSLSTCKCGVSNARCRSVEQWPSGPEVFKHVSSTNFFCTWSKNYYSEVQIYKQLHKAFPDNTSQRKLSKWKLKNIFLLYSFKSNHSAAVKNAWRQIVKDNKKALNNPKPKEIYLP